MYAVSGEDYLQPVPLDRKKAIHIRCLQDFVQT